MDHDTWHHVIELKLSPHYEFPQPKVLFTGGVECYIGFRVKELSYYLASASMEKKVDHEMGTEVVYRDLSNSNTVTILFYGYVAGSVAAFPFSSTT